MDEESKKEKSNQYPAYSIYECLELLEKLGRIGGKKISYSVAAAEVGLSPQTKSFMRKLSASRQFGLVILSGNSIEITSLGNAILYPKTDDESERKKALIESFKNPSLYSKLIERYEDRALPSLNTLSNVLMTEEFGIVKTVKDVAAETFVKSAEQVGVLKNGILDTTIEYQNTNSTVPSERSETGIIDNKNVEQYKASIENDEINVNNSYHKIEIPLLKSNNSVKILIPKNSTVEELEFLKKYMETVLPMFIENLK